MKKTSSFKNADYSFKNMSIQMFTNMLVLSKTNKNTLSVVTSVINGYNSEKAKKILCQIADEVSQKKAKK